MPAATRTSTLAWRVWAAAWLLCLADAALGCRSKVAVEAFPDSFVGIGVELHTVADGATVVRVLTGGAAADAGLVAGDCILTIDGWRAGGESLGDAVMRLRGAPGSQVRLEVRHDAAVRTVVVRREAMRRSPTEDYRPQPPGKEATP